MSRKFQYKAVPSSWLDINGRRLDCGPYMSGAIEAKELLKKHHTEPLKELTAGHNGGIFNGPRFPRIYVDDPTEGIPFLGSTDILTADLSSLKLLSKKQVAGNPELVIDEGWTLITCSGTIGRMAYARSGMKGMAGSQHFMRVVPNLEKIKSGYLYAYLSSRFGVPIVVSGTYGAIIQHIEPHHLAGLPVPRLGDVEDRVHDLVQQAAENLSNYQRMVNEGSANVFEACKIPNLTSYEWKKSAVDKGFSISISELKGILRAWNHSRRANSIIKNIKSNRFNELGSLVDLDWLKWRVMFKRIFADPKFGIEVITQKPLFNLVPEGKWISRDYLLNHSSKYIVPDETILIAKQGTLGENELYCRCEFITGERALAKAYSDHYMRVVVKDNLIHPGYLFAFLRSEAGFRLLRNLSEGSKQQDLHWRAVPSIPVPLCKPEVEIEIGEKIRLAYRSKNKAIEQFDQARTLVEKAIEEEAR